MIVLLCLIYFGIILYEVPGLIEKNYWYELLIFSLLLIFSFIMFVLFIIDVKIPSPVKMIEKIVMLMLDFLGIKI